MAEIMTYDSTNDSVVMESIESNEAEALAIGEELIAQQEQLLAGKYKNAQELEKAYVELQQKLGSQDKETSEPEETPEEQPKEEETDEAVDFLWNVNDEYTKNDGKLSEETMEKFGKMSSKELVEAYFRYQNTLEQAPAAPQGVELSDAEINQVQNYVGGAEKYQQLVPGQLITSLKRKSVLSTVWLKQVTFQLLNWHYKLCSIAIKTTWV